MSGGFPPKRPTIGYDPNLPGENAYRPGGRSTTGDRKRLVPGRNAQFVDVEYGVPGFYLVQGVTTSSLRWEISFGIDRANLRTVVEQGDVLAYIVSARSISLVGINQGSEDEMATGMIVPVNLGSVDAVRDFYERAYEFQETFAAPFGVTPGIAICPVFRDSTGGGVTRIDQTNVAFTMPAGTRIVQNDPTSTSTLFLKIGAGVDAVNSYTVGLVPGAYWEYPHSEGIPVRSISAVWGAAGVGFAMATAFTVP